MKAELANVRKQADDLKAQIDGLDERYVNFRHFDAVFKHVESALSTIQSDLRAIRENLLFNSVGASHKGGEGS